MKAIPLLISFILISSSVFSQLVEEQAQNFTLTPLSHEEQEDLKKVPELKMPLQYKSKDLPAIVDNSTQPYMRSAFQQSGLCCGQAAGIGYNFTYEMSRVRDIPANTNNNLYPTHFTWNFMNGGYGWYGVSFLHSFEILRHCGNMNVTDYGGGLATGGSDRWISGYDEYYNGMGNRVNNIMQIQVGTPEGLDVFKHWINDHLDGSAAGGVGSFYSQYMSASNTLPAGTPEAGKYVLTYFGGSANHAQTIVGYNDSIRYDYNNDGQYTNDIDINSDGVVDMKDWEIGGFKMVQSYGGVPGWGDDGFAYMMYKTVADNLGEGGIWNHCVYVLNVKETCEPQATMKVTITHDKRDRLKVVAGVANNVSATHPEYIMEFPIINYHGGGQYMQGGWDINANKTLEFGLDISPLLSYINLGQEVKFFLQVYENDLNHNGNGLINSFSVIDYTGGFVEHVCPQTDVPINDHDLTSMSVNATFNFPRVEITNTELPSASVGESYSVQLNANGGDAPYDFRLLKQYPESNSSETFPTFNSTQLYPNSSSSGYVTQALDFDFPYYDSSYSSITVHVDGYLMFDEQLFPHPYFGDDMIVFRLTRNISPFMCHDIRLYSSDGDGIWYEGDENQATFRWNASIYDYAGSTDLNFAVRLFPDGRIEYLYGDIVIGDDVNWVSGLNDGNEHDMQFSSFYPDAVPSPNKNYAYEHYNYPEWLNVSEDGLISGVVSQPVVGESITFKVTDNNFVFDTKTLVFSASGVFFNDSISSGGDEKIENGELAQLSVELTNLESNTITNASMNISTNDTYIQITDDNEFLGDIPMGVPMLIENAFAFQVDANIPNNHSFEIEATLMGDTKAVWETSFFYTAYAPVIELYEVVIDDDQNGILDPGETADMVIHLLNTGGADASALDCILSSTDPMITINSSSANISLLEIDSIKTLTYNISVDPTASIGHAVDFLLDINSSIGFETDIEFEQYIGHTLEDFETGNFNLFSWGFMNNRDWRIDMSHPYEGTYCSRSGLITHGEESSMILDLNVVTAGNISFFRMVSCEDAAANNADYLIFLVDGIEQERWDGELDWEEFSFTLSEGYHRLEWKYVKDGSGSGGLDACFVDHISLPDCLNINPQFSFGPEEIDVAMQPDNLIIETFTLTNEFQGELEFELFISSIVDDDGNRSVEGSILDCEQNTIMAGEDFDWDFSLYNASDDDEWITDLIIDLPDGIETQSASNFIGGSNGDLMFTGAFGNGASMNWHFTDVNNYGALMGGESAHASIGGFIHEDLEEDATLNYTIIGDQFGGEPHIVHGNISLTNLGHIVPWISCDIYEGNVMGSGLEEVEVSINSTGLADGNYYCTLIVRDNFQHEALIPVHLLVDTDLGQNELSASDMTIEVFPNPFSQATNINISLKSEEVVTIKVTDLHGRTIDIIADGIMLDAGMHHFNWKPEEGSVDQGMYLIVFENNGERIVKKVIKHD